MWSARYFLLCKLLLLVALAGEQMLKVSTAAIGDAQFVRPRVLEAGAFQLPYDARRLQPVVHEAPQDHFTQLTSSRRNGGKTRSPRLEPGSSSSFQGTGSPIYSYEGHGSELRETDLNPALSQRVTNRHSTLGTKHASFARRDYTDPSSLQAIKDEYPVTGVTRHYKFDVKYADIAPDGVVRQKAILINGVFPGPTIEANYGDWIEVEVTNAIIDEGITVHWHGMLQKRTPWMDGVPSIQQCPIAPGRTFTYRFRADQIGTSWWHSHYSAQYTSGAYGALIIHGENEDKDYDEDIGPIFLSDWYHETLLQAVDTTMHSRDLQPPAADNLLINGKMDFDCSKTTAACTPNASLSKFFFSPGKKYRLRLINSGGATNAKFSIDGHTFIVIAQDFTPLQPYQTDVISLANGQRSDVIVEAIGEAGSSYWMRHDLGDGKDKNACISDVTAPVRTAVAAVYYDGADENSAPSSTSSIGAQQLLGCDNDPLNKTIPAFPISSQAQGTLTTLEMHINFTQNNFNNNGSFLNQWTVNNVSYHANYSRSLLIKEKMESTSSVEAEMNLYDFGANGTVRIVMYHHFPFTHHPMHLHGYDFQILAEGFGVWDGTITNPENPSRRDVHVLNKAQQTASDIIPAYAVIQFFTDNAGIWPLHCHLAWHNSGGLFTNLMIRPKDIQKFSIPDTISQTCMDWNNYASVAYPVLIDSGA